MRRLCIMGLVILIVVALDQVSKYLAVQYLEGKGVLSYFDDSLRLLLAENRGGFLSLGASLPAGLRNLIFVLLTTIFLAGFAVFTLFDKQSDPAVLWASSMIIGGGIGNLIDRILREGAVIDFLNMGIGGLRTGIFNIADMAVLFGCIMLIFILLAMKGKSKGHNQKTGA